MGGGTGLAGALLAAPHAAAAQQSARLHHVGFLQQAPPRGTRAYLETFRQGLRSLAYIEG
jgi:hypothetical protein